MDSQTLERAAYIAAHLIISTHTTHTEFACPGTNRSRQVDDIAGIIKGVFETKAEGPPISPAMLAATGRSVEKNAWRTR